MKRAELQNLPRRFTTFTTAANVASLLAPPAFALGFATLLGFAPVTGTMARLGLPSWSVPVFGVIELLFATIAIAVATGVRARGLGALWGAALRAGAATRTHRPSKGQPQRR